MQNSLRSNSCIFAPDADSCELRVSKHPANAIRETFFQSWYLPVDKKEKPAFTVLPHKSDLAWDSKVWYDLREKRAERIGGIWQIYLIRVQEVGRED